MSDVWIKAGPIMQAIGKIEALKHKTDGKFVLLVESKSKGYRPYASLDLVKHVVYRPIYIHNYSLLIFDVNIKSQIVCFF